MSTLVSRLAGALLIKSVNRYFLVGNTKEPCAWSAAGFCPLGEGDIDGVKTPVLELKTLDSPASIRLAEPSIVLDQEGEEVAGALASRLLIARNGSVSERLWRLVLRSGEGSSDEIEEALSSPVNATWLVEMPLPVWNIVREAVLKCV